MFPSSRQQGLTQKGRQATSEVASLEWEDVFFCRNVQKVILTHSCPPAPALYCKGK